jgi:hypothetical protein
MGANWFVGIDTCLAIRSAICCESGIGGVPFRAEISFSIDALGSALIFAIDPVSSFGILSAIGLDDTLYRPSMSTKRLRLPRAGLQASHPKQPKQRKLRSNNTKN